MHRKGEITVFLAMILISVCALLCTVVESARTAGARCYMRMAVDSSMDSLLSQYHRGLWKEYRILGLEYDRRETLEREMEHFLTPYARAENWYPMRTERVKITDMAILTQDSGRYMEQEILDYMKYGLFDTDWDEMDEEGAGKLLETWKESSSVSQISDLYSGHAKEAVQLEKSLEKINDRLISQKQYWEQGRICLESMDGSGFIYNARKMINHLEKLPGLVKDYEKKADKLAVHLKESRARFEEEQKDMSDGVKSGLEAEIEQYESYISRDGQRRQAVEALKTSSSARIQHIEGVISMARDVMEYIDNWDPEDEDDELDEEELWRPVLEQWDSYGMLSLGLEFGVKDKEKEGFLEQIERMAGNGLLNLVLPEGAVASGKKLDLSRAPSTSSGRGEEPPGPLNGSDSTEKGRPTGVKNLLERLLIGEYNIRFFKTFEKEMPENEFYELEYIIHGKENDRDNLAGVASRLVALRQGLNLIHIISDAEKRQEARELALAIVGGTGLLPLVSVMAFFIMAVWALGEALLDVKALLDKGRIPLIKTAGDWKLSLNGLLDIGKSGGFGGLGAQEGGKDAKKGLDYKGYMRIFIFGGYGEEMIYRMMDVMQMVLEKEQPGFSLAHCACAVDMEITCCGKHIFFSAGLGKSQLDGGAFTYETSMAVSGSYMEDWWNR